MPLEELIDYGSRNFPKHFAPPSRQAQAPCNPQARVASLLDENVIPTMLLL